RPAEGVEAEGRPVLVRVAAGIDLLLEAQQAEVAGLVRAEAGDLDVVAQQVREPRHLVHRAGEELLLVIEAWAPGQGAADLQVLAHAVSHHIRRADAFGRVRVMRAAGGVDVVVAGPPAQAGGVDTALPAARAR